MKKFTQSLLATRAAALVLCSLIPLTSQAHRSWIAPVATVYSGDEPWASFDAAVSNDIFVTNHAPMRLDNLRIHAPDGKLITPPNIAQLKQRVSFDLPLTVPGTYKIASASGGLTARWETASGERKFWPERGKTADPSEFKTQVPKKAKNLEVAYNYRRVETYVTRGAPSFEVFKPTGEGLELAPVTHPNDLVAGETAQWVLLMNGSPAVGAEVSVLAEGTRYRNSEGEMNLQTDATGKLSITWPGPGRYFIEAQYSDKKAAKPAKSRRASYSLVAEVLQP